MKSKTLKSRLAAGSVLVGFAVAGVVSVGCAAPASAQTSQNGAASAPTNGAGAPNASQELETVVVVAQRRAENLQNVPIAVSAMSGEELKTQGVTTTGDLQGKIPNFTVRDGGLINQFNIRGSVSNSYDPTTEAPVAVYTDEVYRGAAVSGQSQIFDIDHVEVLRGPQGTLFGRNSTGGLVHFLTREPTDALSGYVNAEAGSFGQRIIDGALSGPLTDKLQGRIAFSYNQDDGWQSNDERPGSAKWNAKNAIAYRIKLRAELTDNIHVEFTNSLDHERNRYQGYSYVGAVNPATGHNCTLGAIYADQCTLFGGQPSLSKYDPRHIRSSANSLPWNLETIDNSLKIEWKLNERNTITSITANNFTRWEYAEDDNGTGIASRDNGFTFFYGGLHSNQLTEEIRLNGEAGKFRYTAGLYYFYSDQHESISQYDPSARQVTYPSLPHITINSPAVFGELTYDIDDQWSFISGLRYTTDSKTEEFSGTDYSGKFTTPLKFNAKSDTSAVTWKESLQWRPSDQLMVYATGASGYKSPEFNVEVFGSLPSVLVAKAEKVVSFEVGEKGTFFDNRLRLNLDAYVNKTRNKQGTSSIILPNGNQGSAFYNFGDVTGRGVEAEITARPVAGLDIGASAAYTYTRISSSPGNGLKRTADNIFYPFNGSSEFDTPEYTYNIHAKYTMPTSYGDFAIQPEWRWQSKVYWTVANNANESEKSYGVANLRLMWTSPTGKINATAFVENLADQRYANARLWYNGADTLLIEWGKPRWYGFRLGYAF